MVGIRMVRVGGRPLGFLGSTIRNIIRLADFLPILYGVGVLVMFIDRQSRRLGDMAAGSLAVRDRKAVTLDMLTAAPIVEAPVVMAADQQNIPNLTVLHPEDFAMVETYLRRRTQIGPEVRKRLDNTILDGLEQRLGYPVQRDTRSTSSSSCCASPPNTCCSCAAPSPTTGATWSQALASRKQQRYCSGCGDTIDRR